MPPRNGAACKFFATSGFRPTGSRNFVLSFRIKNVAETQRIRIRATLKSAFCAFSFSAFFCVDSAFPRYLG
jgi:hypothetical protein